MSLLSSQESSVLKYVAGCEDRYVKTQTVIDAAILDSDSKVQLEKGQIKLAIASLFNQNKIAYTGPADEYVYTIKSD